MWFRNSGRKREKPCDYLAKLNVMTQRLQCVVLVQWCIRNKPSGCVYLSIYQFTNPGPTIDQYWRFNINTIVMIFHLAVLLSYEPAIILSFGNYNVTRQQYISWSRQCSQILLLSAFSPQLWAHCFLIKNLLSKIPSFFSFHPAKQIYINAKSLSGRGWIGHVFFV